MTLTYKPHALIEDLALGECTVHRASNASAARWWLLWFYVARETDGQPETFCVPVAPNDSYSESGPGGRTWGLTNVGSNRWQVAPSINVLNNGESVNGEHSLPSLWHQTPQIVGVPDSENWATGAAA